MKNQLPVIADVKGLGKIVEVCNEFNMELRQFAESGARLISPRDEAYARLQTLRKENIGKVYGTRTTSGFEYARGQFPIFRVTSRLVDPKLAKQAVRANRNAKYFHTSTTKEYEDSLKQAEKDRNKDPIDRNFIVLPSREAFRISDKENWEIYEVALKDQAKPYFNYNGPIIVYPIFKGEVDEQPGTILNVLWFRALGGASLFYGFSRSLNDDDRARGVFVEDVTNSGKTSFNSLYTQEQLSKNLRLLQEVRDGSRPPSDLEKVTRFLKGLR